MSEPQMSAIADIISKILIKLSLVRGISAHFEAEVRKFVLKLAFDFPVYRENIIQLSEVPPVQLQLTANSPTKVRNQSSLNCPKLTSPRGDNSDMQKSSTLPSEVAGKVS